MEKERQRDIDPVVQIRQAMEKQRNDALKLGDPEAAVAWADVISQLDNYIDVGVIQLSEESLNFILQTQPLDRDEIENLQLHYPVGWVYPEDKIPPKSDRNAYSTLIFEALGYLDLPRKTRDTLIRGLIEPVAPVTFLGIRSLDEALDDDLLRLYGLGQKSLAILRESIQKYKIEHGLREE